MKKTLVVLLALMMVFAFATTAMAADEQYVPYADIADQDVDIQTAIERLTILGALTGYDAEGTKYAPAQLITREEFATIGVRIAGLEDQVALYASMASAFKDVEEGRWSEGYINAANANGIMIGRGNGVFDPKANVTMQEVTTVLLRAVGYDDRLPGAWPSDYNTKAVNVGITEYVDYIGPKAATRGEVASLVNETLDLWTVQYVEDTTGLGQIIGGMIQIATGENIPVVDKDGYMYVIDATNEEGNYGTTLLNQTFDAGVVYNAIFNDNMAGYSEANAWGFDNFDKWELEAYYGYYTDRNPVTNETTREFASLYGVSRGQDVTDLGLQVADLTINADGEIIYIDLTTDIVRTADATKDQAKDAEGVKFSSTDTITKGRYGEIWYDADGDAYAAKDYEQFADDEFGIVDDVDEDGVYFKNDADLATAKLTDLDLDDDYAFYLVGEGFIEAADLEEGDVIYVSDIAGAEGLALVYRPVAASLDDLARNSIEIDDVVYGAIEDYSFFSYNQGSNFEDYDYQRILDLDLDFSDSVAFVPAYAFANFAYFTDDLQHAGAGVIENYVISSGGHRLDNAGASRNVTGMYVLFAGDDEATLVEFDSTVTAGEIDGVYPVEGSYFEYTLNADGELMVTPDADDFDNVIDFGDETYKDEVITGEWTASNRLALNATGLDDVYRFAAGAVIYLVDSEDAAADPEIYDFDSAQALTLDEFEKLGDFTADGLAIIDANGTTINALYVRDADFTGDIAYGIGLYEGDGVIQSRSDRFYMNIDGERVFIDDKAADAINTELGDTAAIVAYKTEGGKVVAVADICVVGAAGDVDQFSTWIAANDFADAFDYEMLAGTVNLPGGYTNSYGQIDLDVVSNATNTAVKDANKFTFICDATNYINGYDFNDVSVTDNHEFGKLAMSDFKDRVADNASIIGVYLPGNDLVYLLILVP